MPYNQKSFLIYRLKDEWNLAEKAARKEALVRQTKESARAIGKGILTLLAVAGVITVAAVAPNIFAGFGKLGQRRFYEKRQFRKTANYLKEKGFVGLERSDEGGYRLKLTDLGLKTLLSRTLNDLKIKPEEPWDGIWRLVLSDIPDTHKNARDALRHRLKMLGFYCLQKSVFVTPYPCKEEIDFLNEIYRLAPYMRYIETRTLIHDADLRRHFNLSLES